VLTCPGRTAVIEDTSFGRMEVAGEVHVKDLIVFAPCLRGEGESVAGGWWRKSGHAVVPADLETVVAAKPDVLVIGRGAHGRVRVPDETLDWLRGHGIEPEIHETTARAAARYNALLAEGRRVAGAFHLTC
jgi:hypothetical protein